VTYFVRQGSAHFISQQQVSIAAMGLAQVNANTFLHVPATVTGSGSADTSLVVQSLPDSNGTVLPIAVERSLYFNYGGTMPGSTSVMGFSG
jgi:hypothetical protein